MNRYILIVTLGLAFLSCKDNLAQKLDVIYSLPNSLKEVSGIAISGAEILVHEDSGNNSEITVLDQQGKIKRTIAFPTIKNKDWEDIEIDANSDLYIGDFGNNANIRQDLVIYKVSRANLTKTKVTDIQKIEFSYPEQTKFPPSKSDLKYDVEAFVLYKDNFYLFTKNRAKKMDGTAYVYKVPNVPGKHKAQRIATIATCTEREKCMITGAALSPDQKTIALLSHTKIWLYKNFENEKFTDPKVIDLDHFSQKEAIVFKDNNTVLVADEVAKKRGGNIYQINLQKYK